MGSKMRNGKYEDFLKNLVYYEALLYYAGHVYFFNGYKESKKDLFVVDIYKYKGRYEAGSNEQGEYYVGVLEDDGMNLMTIKGLTPEEVEEKFLKEKLFDEKSFWEVQDEIVWVDWQ